MSPSLFAKSAGWTLGQSGPAAINCLRPADRSGLPISLLHPAFANFRFILAQPMPSNGDAAKAMAAARRLCTMMPDHFKDEAARKDVLFKELEPLFVNGHLISVSYRSVNPDGILFNIDRVPTIVLELKNEPGAAGDVYMQCARSFDAVAIQRLGNRKEAEFVAFVVAVDGE
jgi:hypothetical protein